MKTENKMDISEQVMTKRKGDIKSGNIIEKGKSELLELMFLFEGQNRSSHPSLDDKKREVKRT